VKSLRVLLADDHALVRAGMRALLASLGVQVVAEAVDGADALRLIAQLSPTLALMDVSMPGMNGLEVTRRAAKRYPKTRILMLSMHADGEYVRQSLAAGASGYLLKSSDRNELEMALRAVARGDIWLSPIISRSAVAHLHRSPKVLDRGDHPVERLTPRQREVLQLVVEGHPTKLIAQRLGISVKTVETHRAEIMDRLEVSNLASLVHYAIRTGMLPPEA